MITIVEMNRVATRVKFWRRVPVDVGKKEGRRYVSNFYSNSVEIIPTVPTYLSTLAGAKITRGKASKGCSI